LNLNLEPVLIAHFCLQGQWTEIPNPKLQITNKSQISLSNDQNLPSTVAYQFAPPLSLEQVFGILNFGHWNLPFNFAQVVSLSNHLRFVFWCLEFIQLTFILDASTGCSV
jgi:hypothetical protein